MHNNARDRNCIKTRNFRERLAAKSCMGMFVFACCPFALLSCKIVSEIVHSSSQLEGTHFPFIILLAFVDAGMVNGEHSEEIILNALYGRTDLRQLVSQCTCGMYKVIQI